MQFNNNVIPIYVNSKDRIDVKKPSTDMTIRLSKSMRNISSINISDVVIPENELLINSNNSALSGYVLVNGEIPFSIDIKHGNYTIVTLGQEVLTSLQNNIVFIEFGITWSLNYDLSTRTYIITASYPTSIYLTSWGIRFSYSALIDILGIGGNGTVDKTFTTANIILPIDTLRSPSVQKSLYYNITSSALTNDINTSYLHSLAKNFNVTNGNVSTEIKYKTNEPNILPEVIGGSISNSVGTDVVISAAGLNLYVMSDREVINYSRASLTSEWKEDYRFSPTIDYNFSLLNRIAVSEDLSTIAVASYTDNNSIGAVWVYIKTGFTYTEYVKLVSPNYIGTPQQGVSVSINSNGTIIAIGGNFDDNFNGAIWIWQLIGITWTQIQNIKGTSFSRLGKFVSIDSSGNIIAASEHVYDSNRGRVWVYATIDTWATYTSIEKKETVPIDTTYGESLDLSEDGKTLAIGGYGYSSGIGRVWLYTQTITPFDTLTIINPSSPLIQSWFGRTISLNNDGSKIVIGGYRDNTQKGAIWISDFPFTTLTKITYTDTDPEPTAKPQLGFSVSISNNGIVAAGRNSSFNKRGDIIIHDSGFTDILVIPTYISDPKQGSSVSISEDNSVIAVGASADNGNLGGTWVYSNNNQLKIVGTGSTEVLPGQGTSVSLSGNGIYLAIGGPSKNTGTGIGTVWIYKSTDNWLSAIMLQVINETSLSNYGSSVKLSYDGKVLIVGALYTGKSYIYRTTNDWATLPSASTQTGTATSYGRYTSINRTGTIFAIGDPEYKSNIGRINIRYYNGLTYIDRVVYCTITVDSQGRVALNGAGDILVVGGVFNTSGSYPGRAWVVTTTNNWATYVVTEIIITDNIGNASFGAGVSINIEGNIAIIGGPTDNNGVGAIWKCTTTDRWLTYTTTKLFQPTNSIYPGTNFGGTSLVNTDGYIVAGCSNYKSGVGRVLYWVDSYLFESYSVQVPSKLYTLFELSSVLSKLLQLDEKYSITATYNMINKINLTIQINCPEAYFTVTTDIPFITWNTPTYVSSVASEQIDMSINNNILKTVINAPENGLVIDRATSNIYRKYKPGFTINETDVVDIQLRNERDEIVDLGDINWVMVIYVTIHF